MSRDDRYFAATAISGKLRVWGIVLYRPWDAKRLIFHPEWSIDFWLLDRPLDRKAKTLTDLGEILSRSFDWHPGCVVWIHESLEREVRRRWGTGGNRKWDMLPLTSSTLFPEGIGSPVSQRRVTFAPTKST